jgi:hypothetical protein
MGPRILHRRKPERKTSDERRIASHRRTTDATEDSLVEDRDDRQRRAAQAAVTHRSPSPDDNLLPCCGLPLSEVHGNDRITTDPAQVTCGA